jgi:WD40 repeat protein
VSNTRQPKAASAPKELGKPLNPGVQVTRVRFSPDGKLLAAACFDGTVMRWDMTGKEPAELPAITGHNGWVTSLAFTNVPRGVDRPRDTVLFSVDSWSRLAASDVSVKEPRRLWTVNEAHDGWTRAVALSSDKALVATCGKDGFVHFWSAGGGKPDVVWKIGSDVLSLAFHPDTHMIYAGDLFGVVREFNFVSGKPGRTFEAKELYKLDRIQDVGGVKCLLVSGDGKTLFAGGAEPKTGGFVQCVPLLVAIDIASGKRVSQWKGANDNEGYVTDLAWHKDGFVIFTTSGQPGQGKFHIWKPGDEKTLFSGGKHPNCHSVAQNPDGTVIAVSATNANSSGNGRVKGAGGEYPANTSPIQLWSLPGK